MVEHCDFFEQHTIAGEGGALRPDMLVRLPGGKVVVVDSKVPLDGYLSAIEASSDQERELHSLRHARQTREHIAKLASKGYQRVLELSPEFVVMFIPSDGIYQAALAEDPALIEYGVSQQVLLATPTTLIGLLWAVHYGWRQELIAQSAREIADSGRELHSRLGRFVEPFSKLGRQLDSAVGAYNDAVGSFDHRVIPQVRRIEQAGAGSGARWRHRRRSTWERARSRRERALNGIRPSRGQATSRRRFRQRFQAFPAAPEHDQHQRRGHRDGGGQLFHRQEQEVEQERQHGHQHRRPQLLGETELARQQGPQGGRDEEIAVAHHRRAEHGGLQPRQAAAGWAALSALLGALQQVGRHQRRVGHGHQDDPPAEPSRGCHGGQQHPEGDAAESRQRERRRLTREVTAVGPRQCEQRDHQQRPPAAGPAGQSPRASAASSGTHTSAR